MSVLVDRLLEAVSLVDAVTPGDAEDPAGFVRYGELDPHIGVLADVLEGVDGAATAVMLGNLGRFQMRRGLLVQAETTQRRALTINEAVYGPDHHQVATTLGNLGIIQQELGRLDEAETTMRRAATIFEAVFGTDHPITKQASGLLHDMVSARIRGGSER